jgi:hypothetical protein
MAIQEYVVGQPVVYREHVYTDSTRTELIDPDDISLTIKPPGEDAVAFTYSVPGEVQREEQGIYAVTYTPEVEGDWPYRWETVNPASATQGLITIYENNVD